MTTEQSFPATPFLVNCGAVVLMEENVLLVRQARPPFRGLWNFPIGKLDAGESITDCVRREVFEESNVRIARERLLGIWQTNNEHGTAIIIIMFRAVGASGQIKPNLGEILEVRWHSVADMEEMVDDLLVSPEMRVAVRLAIRNEPPLDQVRVF